MSELGGEKIDIIEWSSNMIEFIEDSLSPARVLSVRIESEPTDEGAHGHAVVEVASDQQSLAIGRGGQNVRLAAKLTGWKIDIISQKGEELAEADTEEDTSEKLEDAPEAVTEEISEQTPEVISEEEVEDEATADRDPLDLDEADEVDTPEEAEKNLS